jgi:naphthoate synthase
MRTSDTRSTCPTAIITIDRPRRYSAFRGLTVEELIRAFRAAWAYNGTRAIILT